MFLIGEDHVEVSWTVDRLSGTTSARASQPVALDVATPTATADSKSGVTVYEASETYELTSRLGMAFSMTWVRGVKGARISYCFSDEEGILPESARTAGACLPVGRSSFASFHDDPRSNGTRSFALSSFIFMSPYDNSHLPGDGSRWTYGFVATAPGESESVGSQAMILSY
jgi:hypothetical protein